MEPGWYVAADLAGGWNSWALYGKVEATYRHPLREKMDMVWSHGELGYRLAVSPAATRWGVHGEIMPAAFFRLRLHYDSVFFHGFYGSLRTMPRNDVPHDEADIAGGPSRPGVGHRVWLNAVLQGKWKALALRNATELVWYAADTAQNYFFNWEYETISKQSDFVFENRFGLLVNLLEKRSPHALYVGPFYALVLQPSTDFRRQRAGIDLYAEPFGPTRRMGTPRIYVIAGMNIEETYRTGELYVIASLGSTWDLR